MPANIESMFSVREVPWHQSGTIMEDYPKSIEEALAMAGQDWTVSKVPLWVAKDDEPLVINDFEEASGFYGIQRDDTKRVLGVVGERYRPFQNRDAFAFLNNLIGHDLKFETAGVLGVGERVWVLCQIPDYVEVGGDTTREMLLITNGHDGKSPITVCLTPIRVVCQNTLSWALSSTKSKFSVRHTENATARIHEARKTLELSIDYYAEFKEFGDQLALVPMKQDKVLECLTELLYPQGTEDMSTRAANNLDSAKMAVSHILNSETKGNAPNTKWSGVNAICEYLDWYRPTRGDSDRFARINFEATNPKQKALELVVAA